MIQYRPGVVPTGIVTLFTTVAIAAPARGPTVTSPSTVSPGSSSVASVDRYSREVDAAAAPGASARFFTTCVTLTLAPAAIAPGVAVTDVTVRSGFTTWIATVARLLFVSLASSISPFGCGAARVRAHDQEVRAGRRIGRNRHRRHDRARSSAPPRGRSHAALSGGYRCPPRTWRWPTGRCRRRSRASSDRPDSSRCS